MTAARLALMFHMDPVEVLLERDPFKWAVRLAAFQQLQEDERVQHDKAKAASKSR